MGYWILVNHRGDGDFSVGTLLSDYMIGGTRKTKKSLVVFTTWSKAHWCRYEKAFEEDWKPTPLTPAYQSCLATNPLQCSNVVIDVCNGRRQMPVAYPSFFSSLHFKPSDVNLAPTEGFFVVKREFDEFRQGTFLRIWISQDPMKGHSMDDYDHLVDHFGLEGTLLRAPAALFSREIVELFISQGNIEQIGFHLDDAPP